MWNRLLESFVGSSPQQLIIDAGILLSFLLTASLLVK